MTSTIQTVTLLNHSLIRDEIASVHRSDCRDLEREKLEKASVVYGPFDSVDEALADYLDAETVELGYSERDVKVHGCCKGLEHPRKVAIASGELVDEEPARVELDAEARQVVDEVIASELETPAMAQAIANVEELVDVLAGDVALPAVNSFEAELESLVQGDEAARYFAGIVRERLEKGIVDRGGYVLETRRRLDEDELAIDEAGLAGELQADQVAEKMARIERKRSILTFLADELEAVNRTPAGPHVDATVEIDAERERAEELRRVTTKIVSDLEAGIPYRAEALVLHLAERNENGYSGSPEPFELRPILAAIAAELRPEEEALECEGHPADEYGPMGETRYCDGSCRRVSRS